MYSRHATGLAACCRARPRNCQTRRVQIFHVTRATDWQQAQASGRYEYSTAGKTLDEVGFIHASTPEQVAATAERVYAGTDEPLVVLVLDTEQIQDASVDVRFEDGGNGQQYPHIYGPIELDWVSDVRPARFDDAGSFVY